MFIITSDAGSTYQARIYTSPADGFKFRYSATCTEGHLCAAKQVVRKNYGNAAAESVQQITDPIEAKQIIGDYASRPRSPRSFRIFTFKH